MHSGPLPNLPDPGWTCRPPPAVSIPPQPVPKPDTHDDPPLQPPPSRGKSLIRPGDEQLDNETRAALERLDSFDKDERGRLSMRQLGFREPASDEVARVKELLKLRGAQLDDAFARAAAEPLASYELGTGAAVDGVAAADAARAWDVAGLPRVLRLSDGSYHLLDGDAIAAAQSSSARGLSPLGGLRARVVNAPLNRLPKKPPSRAAALQELGDAASGLGSDRASQARLRLALQDVLKGDGMLSRDNFEIRQLAERVRVIRSDVIRAGHAWNGEVEVGQAILDHAQAGLTAARAGRQLSSQQQRAISTLFHEEIHGASPMARSAYQAHGAALEEAGAEILARRQARKLLSLKPGADDPLGLPTKPITSKVGAGEMAKIRPYEGPVSRLLSTVARFDVPAADVEAALIRMREAGAARYETADAYLSGFVAELPVTEAQRSTLTRQLKRALRSTTLELERSQWRGHDIIRVSGPGASSDDVWVYADTHEPVAWLAARPCGRCGAAATSEGHDGCLGALPGVSNACCGHGMVGDAYVQFDDGRHLAGQAALAWQRAAVGKSSPPQTAAIPATYSRTGLAMGQNGGIGPVYELERNDTEGAVRVYEAAVGQASEPELQDLARMLARLQDNPASAAELLGYFEELGG